MARTPDDIVKTIIGEQVIQIAVLTAKLESLEEQLKLTSDNRTKDPVKGAI